MWGWGWCSPYSSSHGAVSVSCPVLVLIQTALLAESANKPILHLNVLADSFSKQPHPNSMLIIQIFTGLSASLRATTSFSSRVINTPHSREGTLNIFQLLHRSCQGTHTYSNKCFHFIHALNFGTSWGIQFGRLFGILKRIISINYPAYSAKQNRTG